MNAIPLQRDDVYYPESDGQPMAETDLHRDEMVDPIHALKRRYRDAPDVYVTGNIFFYYVQGDPRAVVAPDLFLVKGVAKERRRTYKLWEEGRVPSLVIEITSDSTRHEDLSKKKLCYERLGIEEYFLHDPYQDYLRPALQGFRLIDGRYQRIEPEIGGSLRSRSTDLLLRVEGFRLRLVDAVSGRPLLWDEEIEDELERLRR
ncbi:MAG TPA: Uma2 family endonuclease [Thermoanaerobaculia bacterium]|nr:Uma2 family endonuclease [Thermoanaerobaculia bacterium]